MFTTAFLDARSAISAAARAPRPALPGSASEAATRVAPAPPVPQGLRRRHPHSWLPHHRQTLVELLGEHLDAIDLSRAGKTLGRMIVRHAHPGRLLTAPDGWTVSSVARHGQPPTMHAVSYDLRVDGGSVGRYSSGSRYR